MAWLSLSYTTQSWPQPSSNACLAALRLCPSSQAFTPFPLIATLNPHDHRKPFTTSYCRLLRRRFNTWSDEMGEDFLLAVEQLTARGATVRAVVLRGAGAHFSPGGNHYRHEGCAPHAAAVAALRRSFAGFAALQVLNVPIVCAAHGTVIGGGIAACLSCDYIVAEGSATFQHGNLVRGVCPLGGLSRTLPHAAGRARALSMYLGNDTLSAAEARATGIVHEVSKPIKL